MKIEKIGELNFGKFKTEFKMTPKVKKLFEDEDISLATLIPEAWFWYEVLLFETLDENDNGIPDKKFGKNFEVIYYGIIHARNIKNRKIVKKYDGEEFEVQEVVDECGGKIIEDDISKFEERIIDSGEFKHSNIAKTKFFNVRYIVIPKK